MADIARCDAVIELGSRLPGEAYVKAISGLGTCEIACEYPEAFDLSDDDVKHLRFVCEYVDTEIPGPDEASDWHERGNLLVKRLEGKYGDMITVTEDARATKRCCIEALRILNSSIL